MEKLLAEKKLTDEEKKWLKEKLKEVESKKNRDSSNSNSSSHCPRDPLYSPTEGKKVLNLTHLSSYVGRMKSGI